MSDVFEAGREDRRHRLESSRLVPGFYPLIKETLGCRFTFHETPQGQCGGPPLHWPPRITLC